MRDFPLFGRNVFTQSAMQQYMSEETYASFAEAREKGAALPPELADAVADAMMNWACDRGATHFSHWFQPLTGVTAEKHDAFIRPQPDGSARFALSGRALIYGEPDASSFPSGGLRATFEARGLTTWDYTSPAFLKEDVSGVTLCIPTSFCSFNGHSLDEKTPLLRSMEALDRQGLHLLRLLGDEQTQGVIPMVGAEQEYFLVDAVQFNRRMDMVFTGRTLFGARPTKSQEMEGHYFGAIKERIAAYMRELDQELWKMGVASKTRHNESAPAQHELAPVFECANLAADHNQLIMETMQRVAGHHGLRCLLHGKPFAFINGSGKHNNFSLFAGDKNLVEPGETRESNLLFLAVVAAVVAAADKRAGLLRAACATLDNDLRLGGGEAPPAVLSISLGAPLTDALEALAETGRVSALPTTLCNQSDRNRTSPLAFTGDRFEFRMLPSSLSISWCNTVLGVAVADELRGFCEVLEGAGDPWDALSRHAAALYRAHRRVVHNGNGYGEDWEKEAARRGLPCLRDTVEALPEMLREEAVSLFIRHGVLMREELEARAAVRWEEYVHDAFLEASTMLEVVDKQVLPACARYQGELARDARDVREYTGVAGCQGQMVADFGELLTRVRIAFVQLKDVMEESKWMREGPEPVARYFRDRLLPAMRELRAGCDALERVTPDTRWPFPTYNELLFNI